MEVRLVVPVGTDIKIIEQRYPDLWHEDGYEGIECYWIGQSCEEDSSEFEWMTYDDCVACCGFCEGAIEALQSCIEGNGPWAMSMIRRKDFSSLAIGDEVKADYKRVSDIYWEHFKQGESARDDHNRGSTSGKSGSSSSVDAAQESGT